MKLIAVCVLAGIGVFFSLSAGLGLVRLPDVYCRIQSAGKAVTMGALPVLIAVVVAEGPLTTYGSRALIVAVLLLVVNPAAGHALARAAYKTNVPMWPGSAADEPRAQPSERSTADGADRADSADRGHET